MRKIISAIVLVSFLVLPILAFAQIEAPKTCKLKRSLTDIDPACTNGATVEIEKYGMCCLVNTIYSVTDWIFYVLMAFVGIMIVIGAFTIITAGGSPEKVTSGRNFILYAVIGMVVAFFARAIPAIVKAVISVG
jgi:hypothetical protein